MMGWDYSALFGAGVAAGIGFNRIWNDWPAVKASIFNLVGSKPVEAPKASDGLPKRKPAKKGKGSVKVPKGLPAVGSAVVVKFPANKKSRSAKGKRKTG